MFKRRFSFSEALVVPFKALVSVFSPLLFFFFGCYECGFQSKGLLQLGIEVSPVVDMEFEAVNSQVKPGLCLGV